MAPHLLDAYCGYCDEMRRHSLDPDDPTLCRCLVCGRTQQTYEPVIDDAPAP